VHKHDNNVSMAIPTPLVLSSPHPPRPPSVGVIAPDTPIPPRSCSPALASSCRLPPLFCHYLIISKADCPCALVKHSRDYLLSPLFILPSVLLKREGNLKDSRERRCFASAATGQSMVGLSDPIPLYLIPSHRTVEDAGSDPAGPRTDTQT
jgi:hypothetical protein